MATIADPADGTADSHRTAGPEDTGGHAGGTVVVPLGGTGDRNPGGKAVR